MLSTTTIPEIKLNCILCSVPTNGSIGAGGLFWKSICQPCKDKEDAALLEVCKVAAACVDAVLHPVQKVQCANPFCDAPNKTECAGEELCEFCQAEERSIILNYKDESCPPTEEEYDMMLAANEDKLEVAA